MPNSPKFSPKVSSGFSSGTLWFIKSVLALYIILASILAFSVIG